MDKNNLRTEAGEYLRLWDSMRERTGDDAVALAVFQEFMKDQRLKRIQEARILAGEGGPATRRQRDYLRSLNIRFDPTVSKQKASELIDDALDEIAKSEEAGAGEAEEEPAKVQGRIP